jgi:hypothetical protein
MFYAPCVAEYEEERAKKGLEMAGVAVDERVVDACMA